jgi:DNA end-binding protein Ku
MAATVWRGFVTFGLISIPVRLFRAARSERVSLRKLYRVEPAEKPVQGEEIASLRRGAVEQAKDFGKLSSRVSPPAYEEEPVYQRVQQTSVAKDTGDMLPPASVVKGYEYERNRFVSVEPEELKSITAKTSTEMELLEFVKLADIDPVYFETSYYVRPEESGERAYALLYRALQTTGLVAIGRIAMHGREHITVLRPGRRGIITHTLYFNAEVRASDEHRAEVETIKPNELKLSEQLIHSLAGEFEPAKYKDTYREKLEAIIAAKVEGRPAPVEPAREQPKQVIDITEALKRSLAQVKKPPARQTKSPPVAKKTVKAAGKR